MKQHYNSLPLIPEASGVSERYLTKPQTIAIMLTRILSV